jgi:YD repeat-containing protein
MAVRQPLYYNSGNLQEMTTTQVAEIVDQVVYQYSLNPSVSLSVVGSSGSLDAITDTRLQAGATSTSVTAFPSEATTAEPSVVTVTYDKISETRTSVTPTTDTGTTWPVYYTSSGQIQAMTLTDVKDTFLHPAIDLLSAATTTSQQAGTYHINTSTTVSGSTEVSGSNTAIFVDTQADTSLYTAGGIGETLDQPKNVTSYYLFKVDGSDTSFTAPLFVEGSNNLQTYPDATFKSLMQEWIRYTAVSSTDGYSSILQYRYIWFW